VGVLGAELGRGEPVGVSRSWDFGCEGSTEVGKGFEVVELHSRIGFVEAMEVGKGVLNSKADGRRCWGLGHGLLGSPFYYKQIGNDAHDGFDRPYFVEPCIPHWCV